MKEDKYQDDLLAIRSMMERSSRFISLNGLAGVFAGIYALVGAVYVYIYLSQNGFYNNSFTRSAILTNTKNENTRIVQSNIVLHLFIVAIIILAIALSTCILFTINKSKKNNLRIWDGTTKRLLFNFAVPICAGGLFSLILLQHEFYGYIAPVTLIFYGLALFSAGNFTYADVKYLGVCEIILGLIAALFLGYGLVFWAIGFGILHIVYGILMYVKYK